jgi:hypothetical protein
MTVGSRAGALEASGHQLRTTIVEACVAACCRDDGDTACGSNPTIFSTRSISTAFYVG